MAKTILLTGATDGIGLEAARKLVAEGHQLLLHGRSAEKMEKVVEELDGSAGGGSVTSYLADLSSFEQVEAMAAAVLNDHSRIDVIINNAGIFKTPHTRTPDGLDIRFVVNTISPYLLTKRLLTAMDTSSRVVNLSSAAQATVNTNALMGEGELTDNEAYAQSKLAITMWSRQLGLAYQGKGPVIVAVNPGSLLGSKMVKEAYGIPGGDIGIGADILVRASLSEEFKNSTGEYWDNDSGRFAPPHRDALDPDKCAAVVASIESILSSH